MLTRATSYGLTKRVSKRCRVCKVNKCINISKKLTLETKVTNLKPQILMPYSLSLLVKKFVVLLEYIIETLTDMTIFPCPARLAGAAVSVDEVFASASILTRLAGTLVDI